MSPYKTACALSLGSALVLIVGCLGFMLTSEVRAGGTQAGFDDLPLAGTIDQDTLAQASAFDGDYVFIGGQKEREGLDAAIELAMDAVAPIVRGIGRKRLHETNPIPKRLSIKVKGDDVVILFDGQGHGASLDGKPVRAESAEGEKIKISHRMRGNQLHERCDGAKGARTNDFKLSSDGKRLTVTVSITSGHLPVPVDYRLSFKRQ